MVGSSGSSSFGDYFVYGGLSASGANITVEPGQYVLAGVQQGNGGNSANVLSLTSNPVFQDTNTTDTSNYAGEMFILTDPQYPGVSTQTSKIPSLSGASTNLAFGSAEVQAGSDKSVINLHGIAASMTGDAALTPFDQILFWQDQRNSNVKYKSDGNIDISCGDINSPCTNASSNARQFQYIGGGSTKANGIYYQPRGAWMLLGGNSKSAANFGKTMIVTGALQVSGTAEIDFGKLQNPPTTRVIALVE
jgi:hypothetical protein